MGGWRGAGLSTTWADRQGVGCTSTAAFSFVYPPQDGNKINLDPSEDPEFLPVLTSRNLSPQKSFQLCKGVIIDQKQDISDLRCFIKCPQSRKSLKQYKDQNAARVYVLIELLPLRSEHTLYPVSRVAVCDRSCFGQSIISPIFSCKPQKAHHSSVFPRISFTQIL